MLNSIENNLNHINSDASSSNKSESIIAWWRIERCRNCRYAVIELDNLENSIKKLMKELDFDNKRKKALAVNKPSSHQVFKISISGCPNSCSQPQIKDVGFQGQVIPVVNDGCILCGDCVLSCPDKAINLSGAGPEINRNVCLNCGRCVRSCPAGVLWGAQVGYRILVGGKLGRRPRLAEEAFAIGNEQDVLSVIKGAAKLMTDKEHATKRLGSIIDEFGTEVIKN